MNLQPVQILTGKKKPEYETGVIYGTRDYDQFKTIPGNRPVSMKHVNELIKVNAENNMLINFPGLVTRDGYLFDGQHRLEAAKANNWLFYFTVSEQTLQEHMVAQINNLQKSWTTWNYMHFFAEQGNEQYKFLEELCEEYKLSPACLIELFGRSGGDASKAFRKGTMTFFETEEEKQALIEFVEGYIRLRGSFEPGIWGHTRFVRALRKMFQFVTAEDIAKEMATTPRDFEYKRTVVEYLRQFEEFFNYHKSEDNYRRFF